MRIMLYGFEPFGGEAVNPSQLVARALDGETIGGAQVVGHVLPVEIGSLQARLARLLEADTVAAVIGLGQAGGNSALAVERLAVNVIESAVPDNQGYTAKGEPVRTEGPAALFSTLPTAEIVERWRAGSVPGYRSDSAGTFCCNQALYETLAWCGERDASIPVGFIHLPYLPGQAAEHAPARTPSMALETMKRGIELTLEVIAATERRRLEEASKGAEEPKRTKGELWIPRGR
ncbi:pyroglutamyl-peptidase I [bacterium]|nr:MAG: pyroglutamyl-peptidase I [bacterium]